MAAGTSTTFGGVVKSVTEDEIVVTLTATNENGDSVLRGSGRIRR